PDCGGSLTTFEFKEHAREFGFINQVKSTTKNNNVYARIIYQLLRCAGCGRGGMAKVLANQNFEKGFLQEFFPVSMDHLRIPAAAPQGIQAEFIEAERCLATECWRAASALLRSTLEKILKDNGYSSGGLADKIDQAFKDGVLTDSRRKKAHEDIRAL